MRLTKMKIEIVCARLCGRNNDSSPILITDLARFYLDDVFIIIWENHLTDKS